MLENRINKVIDNMSIEEKYRLLENIETKYLGDNEKYDSNFMESIVNILLDGTTIIAKIFHII